MNEFDSLKCSYERAYSLALMHLNELIAAGLDEEAEGDAVRDEMDLHWYRMDDRQRRRMRRLSVDLDRLANAMGGPEHVAPIDPTWANEVQQARSVAGPEGADRILALLRDPRAGRSSGNIAFLQARTYEQLGLPEVALAFYEAAEAHNPASKREVAIS